MTVFEQMSIKNQARALAKEAAGDLAQVNKIKGCLVVLMTEKARAEMNPQLWAGKVGSAILRAIPGWEIAKLVNGLMILKLVHRREP